jgi:hypothetical protein
MRVSKVKVDNKNMVLMRRTTGNGALVYEGETSNRTIEILPKQKIQSFSLSIENKTLIKRDSLKGTVQKNKYDVIRAIIKYNRFPDRISAEEVLPFLNHKFQNEIKYYNDNKLHSFLLTSLIVEAVKEKNPQKLQPYFDWEEWYISNKSNALIKSIENNKIDSEKKDSKRKKTLQTWAAEYTDNGSIDLSEYHNIYDIDTLVRALIKADKGELKEDGTPKNANAFHRNLKRTLQDHQKTVFGTREASNMTNRENDQLAVYHLEVVKYLEHYFSVKSTQRRNTRADIDYYLKAETIKNIITKQLLNAVRNYLLQQGKAQHHKFAEIKPDSNSLTEIKRNEAFVLNMIDACGFAANNIRNIVDAEQINDILSKKEYVQSVDSNRVNNQLFKFFFGTDLPETATDKVKTLWAMRGAVQQIRNKVVHYKQKALDAIFNVTDFEYPSFNNSIYTDTIYKDCLETELQKLPEAFAQQLKTGGALTYYPFDDLKTLLNKVAFSLCRSVVPFAPGFKKVQKQGQNYQNAHKENFYNLDLKSYLPKEKFDEEAYNARYFLLKLIYNNLFLSDFTGNREQFSATVNYILKRNKKQAENSRRPKAYAFEAVRQMKKEESITSYMAYAQNQLMVEKNKKEDDKPEDIRINFEKFVLQVFIKGFDDFLLNEKFKFIATPCFQLSKENTKQQQADVLNQFEQRIIKECRFQSHTIKAEEAKHVAFFTFCKLLDATHLSNLRNELIKFKQSSKQFELCHVLEIIELSLLNADVVPADYRELYANKVTCLNRVRPFIADGVDITKWSGLFIQTDNETPVIHANVELTVKYGTTKLLEQLIAKGASFKLSESDFNLWNSAKDTIKEVINKRLSLHKQWEDAIRKDKEEKNKRVKTRSNFAQQFINKERDSYFDLCDYIDAYNWYDSKLHFVNLIRLHHLTIDILGRMVGFVAIWERDFQYMTESISPMDSSKELDFTKGFPLLKGIQLDYYKRIFLSGNYRDIRNYIAHFNYLTDSKFSMIDLINELRELLSYDRKLKNAVNKAFIDLFDKQGMVLKLKLNDAHRFEIESVEPKLLYHLGTTPARDPISTYQVKPQYCDMCKALLEIKNSSRLNNVIISL